MDKKTDSHEALLRTLAFIAAICLGAVAVTVTHAGLSFLATGVGFALATYALCSTPQIPEEMLY